jgi:HK97 family phage prohead protease
MKNNSNKKFVKVYRAQIKSVDTANHIVTAMVSSRSVDRDGEIVTPDAIAKRINVYKAHPVLLSSHRYDDLMKQIGMAEDITFSPEGVTAKFKYFVGQGNPEADWAFKLAQNGIAAYSIGFMAFSWEDKSLDNQIYREFTDVELVEISQVLVPSNRDALAARRSSECDVEKELVELAIKSFEKEAEPVVPEVKPEVKAPELTDTDREAIAKIIMADAAFIEKVILAFKEKNKEVPKGAEGEEGYFAGVLDPAGGSPEAGPEKAPDIKSLFDESASRHFKKE